ncbi:MAG: ParA family protein [Planctomycetes bacterium]|nr:ParA family protein [Planctomycetota bacterium]
MTSRPYVLAIASHKGGTGRTMTTIGIARALAARSKRVLLIDGNITPALHLLLGRDKQDAPIEERELVPGVFVGTGAPGEASRLDADFVLLDCPPIFDRGADAFIGRANGVILTTLPDPLAIRTIPGATSVLKDVLALHDDLSFLGIAVSIYKDDDPLQREMLETLRARLGELCLEPPIPWQRELADWSLDAKCDLPEGPARDAYEQLVDELASEFGLERRQGQSIVGKETAAAPTLGTRSEDLKAPYRLVVASHKGGTGRTTATLALANAFGAMGKRVLLLDANITQTLHLFAQGGKRELFPGVMLGNAHEEADDPSYDIVIVDAPPIFEDASRELCRRADGVLLTTLPDPLAFRTIPGATRALVEAKDDNSALELLGICVSVHDEEDRLQREMVAELRERLGDFCLETAIPLQDEITEWGLQGGPVPEGPARRAYTALAEEIAPRIFDTHRQEAGHVDHVDATALHDGGAEVCVATELHDEPHDEALDAERRALLRGQTAGDEAASALCAWTLRLSGEGKTIPYTLALSSHKGGTGRTVATMALASILGSRGRRVLVFDARATKTLQLFAASKDAIDVNFENVMLATSESDIDACVAFGPDIVLVDTPPLLEKGCESLLAQVDGVLLTVLPDPLAIRTIPGAIHALRVAEASGASFDLLGVLVNVFRAEDPLQAGIWPEIRQQLGSSCLGEPVPWQQEIADWAMQPGSPLPTGRAADAYAKIADHVEESVFGIQLDSEVPLEDAAMHFEDVDTYVLAVSDLAENEMSLTAAALIVAWMTSILGRKVVLVGSALRAHVVGDGCLRFARPEDEHFSRWHGVDLVMFDGCGGAEFSELVGRCHALLETLRDDADSEGILDLARETLDGTGSGRQVLHILMALLDGSDASVLDEAMAASEDLVNWAQQLATGELRAPAVDVLLEILSTIERQITSFEDDWWVNHEFRLPVDVDAASNALGLQGGADTLAFAVRFEELGTPFTRGVHRRLRPGHLGSAAASVLVQKGVVYSEAKEDVSPTTEVSLDFEPRTGRIVDLVGNASGALAVGLRAFLQRRYADARSVLETCSASSDSMFLAGVSAFVLGQREDAMRCFEAAVAQPATLGEELGLFGLGLVLDLDCGDGLTAHCGVNPRAASLMRLFASMSNGTAAVWNSNQHGNTKLATGLATEPREPMKNPDASAEDRGDQS